MAKPYRKSEHTFFYDFDPHGEVLHFESILFIIFFFFQFDK
ncbi:hypothetical protein CLONEX_03493 [[Clostridium] nexile DSM 1787]|nr:hypothetical protein CLONEX_03493 [[Clostridium] nexile DSM 1787]